MISKSILPKSVTSAVEVLITTVVKLVKFELWDEVATLVTERLKNEAAKKYGLPIAGDIFLAETEKHLNELPRNERYNINIAEYCNVQ